MANKVIKTRDKLRKQTSKNDVKTKPEISNLAASVKYELCSEVEFAEAVAPFSKNTITEQVNSKDLYKFHFSKKGILVGFEHVKSKKSFAHFILRVGGNSE